MHLSLQFLHPLEHPLTIKPFLLNYKAGRVVIIKIGINLSHLRWTLYCVLYSEKKAGGPNTDPGTQPMRNPPAHYHSPPSSSSPARPPPHRTEGAEREEIGRRWSPSTPIYGRVPNPKLLLRRRIRCLRHPRPHAYRAQPASLRRSTAINLSPGDNRPLFKLNPLVCLG